MEVTTKRSARKRGPKQGPNARLIRIGRNMTQEYLAVLTGMSQSKISALELQDEIDDETLNKLAAALEVPVDFLKNFEMEEAISSYNANHNDTYEINQTNSDSATGNEVIRQKDVVQQKIVEKEENNYYPLDKVTELYERLLKEKEQQIEELRSLLR